MSTEELARWVPDACVLPSVQRSLRVAEFDALFAAELRGSERLAPKRLRLVFDAGAEAEVRELAARETECCSFFSFSFQPLDGGRLAMEVSVPAAHVGVLDALTARAEVGPRR